MTPEEIKQEAKELYPFDNSAETDRSEHNQIMLSRQNSFIAGAKYALEKKQTKRQFYDSRLQPAYTDLNGNVYYEFLNDGLMTYRRFMSAQVNERSIRLGLTPQFIDEVIKKGLDITYDTKKTEREMREAFSAIFLAMKARAGYVVEEDQYLRLACVYFLIEGEPVDEVNEAFTLRKMRMLAENEDAKDFFLQGAISKTHGLMTTSLDVMKDCFVMATQRTEIAPTLPK